MQDKNDNLNLGGSSNFSLVCVYPRDTGIVPIVFDLYSVLRVTISCFSHRCQWGQKKQQPDRLLQHFQSLFAEYEMRLLLLVLSLLMLSIICNIFVIYFNYHYTIV